VFNALLRTSKKHYGEQLSFIECEADNRKITESHLWC